MNKADFKLHDNVTIVNAQELSGKVGKILGKATDLAEFNSWIVWLMKPTKTHQAIVITEACLVK